MVSAETVRVILVEYYVTEHGTRVFGIVPEAEEPEVLTVGLTRAELRASADDFYALLRGERFPTSSTLSRMMRCTGYRSMPSPSTAPHSPTGTPSH